MTTIPSTMPDRELLECLQLGIAAIVADVTVLDDILKSLTAEDLARAKAYWVVHSPTPTIGYPHKDTPFPCVAVVLLQEDAAQDYLSQGEQVFLNGGERDGFEFKRRTKGVYGLYVMTENADATSWFYRVVRRIANVAIRRLHRVGMQVQVLTGQDLVPDPSYIPAGIYVRRQQVAIEYEEQWRDQDALWAALIGDPEGQLSSDGSTGIAAVDADQDEDGIADGGVSPYTAGEG